MPWRLHDGFKVSRLVRWLGDVQVFKVFKVWRVCRFISVLGNCITIIHFPVFDTFDLRQSPFPCNLLSSKRPLTKSQTFVIFVVLLQSFSHSQCHDQNSSLPRLSPLFQNPPSFLQKIQKVPQTRQNKARRLPFPALLLQHENLSHWVPSPRHLPLCKSFNVLENLYSKSGWPYWRRPYQQPPKESQAHHTTRKPRALLERVFSKVWKKEMERKNCELRVDLKQCANMPSSSPLVSLDALSSIVWR